MVSFCVARFIEGGTTVKGSVSRTGGLVAARRFVGCRVALNIYAMTVPCLISRL